MLPVTVLSDLQRWGLVRSRYVRGGAVSIPIPTGEDDVTIGMTGCEYCFEPDRCGIMPTVYVTDNQAGIIVKLGVQNWDGTLDIQSGGTLYRRPPGGTILLRRLYFDQNV